MRRAYFLIFLLIPCLAWGYQDHRGRDLDSLEQVAARFTPDRLAAASSVPDTTEKARRTAVFPLIPGKRRNSSISR